MSSVPREAGCDRFSSRCGVIGTIKKEKQEIRSDDKLNKQTDGKEKHRGRQTNVGDETGKSEGLKVPTVFHQCF